MGQNLLNPIIARFHEDKGKGPAVNTGVRVQPRSISENKKGLKVIETPVSQFALSAAFDMLTNDFYQLTGLQVKWNLHI